MEEAIRLFKSGMFVKDIAKKLGINPIKLGRNLRKIGLSPKKNASNKQNHPHWKGGKNIAWNGYVRILNREHPRALSNGYVWEHLLVAESKLRRPLIYFGKGDSRNETVHHINGVKTDNRPENLEILTAPAHSQLEWDENPHKFPQSKMSKMQNPQAYENWREKNKNNRCLLTQIPKV